MTPDGKAMLRDLALMLGIPLIGTSALLYWLVPWASLASSFAVVPHVPANGNVFAVIEGRWDWTGKASFCQEDWHVISFAPDRSTMTIRHAQPVGDSAGVTKTEWVYDIVQSDSAGVRGAIRGETRVDAEGKPVVWDLVLTGQDAYRWQQVGWPAFSYTGPVHRCPASAEGAPTDSDADEKVDAPGR